jgi:PAS domain S-box-containing protein
MNRQVLPEQLIPFNEILEAISDSVFLTDEEGSFLYVCKNVTHSLGYSVDEVFEMKTIENLLGSALYDPARLASSGEIENIQFDLSDKNGRTHVFLVNVKTVSIMGRSVLYTFRDVTELFSMRRQLAEDEKKFHVVFDNLTDAVFFHDKEGSFLEVNPAALQMLGYSRSELLQMSRADIASDRMRPKIPGILAELFESGRHFFEWEFRAKDGQTIPVEMHAIRIDYYGHERYVTIARDMSERHAALAAILRHQREIEDKNLALKEIISQVEHEKQQLKRRVQAGLESLVYPLLTKLRHGLRDDAVKLKLIELIDAELQTVCEDSQVSLKSEHLHLSQREIEICTLIRNGLSSKEIAECLSINFKTVEQHRMHIRKKLGLTNNKTNLTEYLQTAM